MGVFSVFEGSLEKYIDSFFKDKFGGRVQPVDIAKKLAREMRDCRRVSISNVYVPNIYTVFLNPEDHADIEPLRKTLAKELEDYVAKKAAEKRYTLTGQPAIKFAVEQALPAGGLRVDSEFSEDPGEKEGPEPEEKPIEQTQPFQPVKNGTLLEAPAVSYGMLLMDSGPDQGKVFKLTAPVIVVGRGEGCDIVLHDDSVSRRHARLERHRNQYKIVDLGSTNGTVVNGIRIGMKLLETGDKLQLGLTTCTFKVE
ncbi:MAG: DUF3662 domain-containing protein [Peptococcaceae bacterium]|jgi:hypothetical protein|nr:DUF3662 domain-containing protein [Peptococcaceae bacterium]